MVEELNLTIPQTLVFIGIAVVVLMVALNSARKLRLIFRYLRL